MLADTFSDVFWPTLWATLFAVVVGIPVGLYPDRRRRAAESKAGESARQQENLDALAVARTSLDNALTTLRELDSDLAKADIIPTHTGLMTGDWRAVRPDVLRALRDDAGLRGMIGAFFDRLDRLAAMNELLGSFGYGALAERTDAADRVTRIRAMERELVTELIAEAAEIVERLDRRTSPRASPPPRPRAPV
ncbi:MAG: hypothetical protein M3P18_12005 [Actinomycetota bacterium]|nr:hypothetical protein [Actinomycetota bacterium]